jgi:hypothetical protein
MTDHGRRLGDSPEVMNDLYSRLGRIEANTEQMIDWTARHEKDDDARFTHIEHRIGSLDRHYTKAVGIMLGVSTVFGILLKLGIL